MNFNGNTALELHVCSLILARLSEKHANASKKDDFIGVAQRGEIWESETTKRKNIENEDEEEQANKKLEDKKFLKEDGLNYTTVCTYNSASPKPG